MKDWRNVVRKGLFGKEVVGEIGNKYESQGWKNLSSNELLILIAAYFNDDLTSLKKNGLFIGSAVISVMLAIIANLIVALLTKQ